MKKKHSLSLIFLCFICIASLGSCKPRRSYLSSSATADLDRESKAHAELSFLYLNYKKYPLLFLPPPSSEQKDNSRIIDKVSGVDPVSQILEMALSSDFLSVRYLAVEIFFEMAFRNRAAFDKFSFKGEDVTFESLQLKLIGIIGKPTQGGRVCATYIECLRKIEHLVAISRNVFVVQHTVIDGIVAYQDELQSTEKTLGTAILSYLKSIAADAAQIDPLHPEGVLISIVRQQAQLGQIWAELAMRTQYFSLDNIRTEKYGSSDIVRLASQATSIIRSVEQEFFVADRFAKLDGQKTGAKIALAVEQLISTGQSSIYRQYFHQRQRTSKVRFVDEELSDDKENELAFFDSLKGQVGATIRQTYDSSLRLWHLINRFKQPDPRPAYNCLSSASRSYVQAILRKGTNLKQLADLVPIEIQPQLDTRCLNRPLHPEKALGVLAPSLEVVQKLAMDPYRNLYKKYYSNILSQFISFIGSTKDNVSQHIAYKVRLKDVIDQLATNIDSAVDDFLVSYGFPRSLRNDEITLAESMPGFGSWHVQMQRTQKEVLDQQRLFYTLKFINGQDITADDTKAYKDFFQGDPLAKAIADGNIKYAKQQIQKASREKVTLRDEIVAAPFSPALGLGNWASKKIQGSFDGSWTRQQYEQEMARLSVYNLVTPLKFACLNRFAKKSKGIATASTYLDLAEQEKNTGFSLSKITGCSPLAMYALRAPELSQINISDFQHAANGKFPLESVCEYNQQTQNHIYSLEKRIFDYVSTYQNQTSCRDFTSQLVNTLASTFMMPLAMKWGFGAGGWFTRQMQSVGKATGSVFLKSRAIRHLANIMSQRFPVLTKAQLGPGLSGLLLAQQNYGLSTVLRSMTYKSGGFLANSAINGVFFTLMHKALMVPLGNMPVQLNKGESLSEAVWRQKYDLIRDIGQGVAFAMLGPAFDGPAKWFNVRAIDGIKTLSSKVGISGAPVNSIRASLYSRMGAVGASSMGVFTEELMFYPVDYGITQGTYMFEEWMTGKKARKEYFWEYVGQNFVGVMVMRRRQFANIGPSLLKEANIRRVVREQAKIQRHMLEQYKSSQKFDQMISDPLADLGVYTDGAKVRLTPDNTLRLAEQGYTKIMKLFNPETLYDPKTGYSQQQIAYFLNVRLKAMESIKLMRDKRFRELYIVVYNNPDSQSISKVREFKSHTFPQGLVPSAVDYISSLFPNLAVKQFELSFEQSRSLLKQERQIVQRQASRNEISKQQALERVKQLDAALSGPYASEQAFGEHRQALLSGFSFDPSSVPGALRAMEEVHFEDRL